MKRRQRVVLMTCIILCQAFLGAQDPTLERTGDAVLFMLPAVSLGASLWEQDRPGTKQFMSGFVLNQALTFGLKWAIKKPRPNGENNNAFPSGHTSTTFQAAAFIQKRYGWAYGVPAYLLAAFTGYSRIHAEKHDVVDVLAGAAIGMGCSFLLTSPYKPGGMQWSLSASEARMLIHLKYSF